MQRNFEKLFKLNYASSEGDCREVLASLYESGIAERLSQGLGWSVSGARRDCLGLGFTLLMRAIHRLGLHGGLRGPVRQRGTGHTTARIVIPKRAHCCRTRKGRRPCRLLRHTGDSGSSACVRPVPSCDFCLCACCIHAAVTTYRLLPLAWVQVLDALRSVWERQEEAHHEGMREVETKLADATGKLAALEAKDKVYSDSMETTHRQTLTLQTEKLRLESVLQATEGRVNQLLSELQMRTTQVWRAFLCMRGADWEPSSPPLLLPPPPPTGPHHGHAARAGRGQAQL